MKRYLCLSLLMGACGGEEFASLVPDGGTWVSAPADWAPQQVLTFDAQAYIVAVDVDGDLMAAQVSRPSGLHLMIWRRQAEGWGLIHAEGPVSARETPLVHDIEVRGSRVVFLWPCEKVRLAEACPSLGNALKILRVAEDNQIVEEVGIPNENNLVQWARTFVLHGDQLAVGTNVPAGAKDELVTLRFYQRDGEVWRRGGRALGRGEGNYFFGHPAGRIIAYGPRYLAADFVSSAGLYDLDDPSELVQSVVGPDTNDPLAWIGGILACWGNFEPGPPWHSDTLAFYAPAEVGVTPEPFLKIPFVFSSTSAYNLSANDNTALLARKHPTDGKIILIRQGDPWRVMTLQDPPGGFYTPDGPGVRAIISREHLAIVGELDRQPAIFLGPISP